MTDVPKRPELFLTVKGTPRPLPRPRVVTKGGVSRAVSITGKAAVGWRRALEVEFGKAVRRARLSQEWPCEGEIWSYSLDVEFAFVGDPRGSDRWHPKGADLDNLVKMLMDAAQAARVIGDDRQIVEISCRKRAVTADPYAAIRFVALEPVEPAEPARVKKRARVNKREGESSDAMDPRTWLTGCDVDPVSGSR